MMLLSVEGLGGLAAELDALRVVRPEHLEPLAGAVFRSRDQQGYQAKGRWPPNLAE